jgi:hypothetical protein
MSPVTAPKTYSPGDTALSIGGFVISGFASGTHIVVEREVDGMVKVVGSDGEVSRTKSANLSGMITITLKQTSASNPVLRAFANSDELSSAGVVPMVLKDNNNNKVFTTYCWVRKQPNMELSDEETNREWIFDCDRIRFVDPPDSGTGI